MRLDRTRAKVEPRELEKPFLVSRSLAANPHMMDAATQILSRADESRLYHPHHWRYFEGIEMVLEDYEKVHPGFQMSDCVAVEKKRQSRQPRP